MLGISYQLSIHDLVIKHVTPFCCVFLAHIRVYILLLYLRPDKNPFLGSDITIRGRK